MISVSETHQVIFLWSGLQIPISASRSEGRALIQKALRKPAGDAVWKVWMHAWHCLFEISDWLLKHGNDQITDSEFLFVFKGWSLINKNYLCFNLLLPLPCLIEIICCQTMVCPKLQVLKFCQLLKRAGLKFESLFMLQSFRVIMYKCQCLT
jgi:hypothetical protein